MASGRLVVLSDNHLDLARDLFARGFSATRVASECGVSLPVIDRYRKAGEVGFPAVRPKDGVIERWRYGGNGV